MAFICHEAWRSYVLYRFYFRRFADGMLECVASESRRKRRTGGPVSRDAQLRIPSEQGQGSYCCTAFLFIDHFRSHADLK